MYNDIDFLIKNMGLKEKIGQKFLQDFVSKEDLTEDLKETNSANKLGGIIFFSGSNVEDIDQLHSLTSNIQSHAKENKYNLPFFITLDQEGGQLSALYRGNTIFPGNMALGLGGDTDLAYKIGNHVGRELRYAGINLCFAPVLDVSYDHKNGVNIVDNRMFSSDPTIVADMGEGFIKGVQDAGVIACAKHFPGQRLTQRDTHHQADVIDYSLERLKEVELVPFKRAISAGVKAIMMHHGVYTALDNLPASISQKVISFLRNELQFNGLIITDDLVMKSITDVYGYEKAIEMAVNAGVDLIIASDSKEWAIDLVADRVKKGIISEDIINESLARILSVKTGETFSKPDTKKRFSIKKGNKLSYNLSKKSIIKYKDDKNILPLRLKKNEKLGIILANPARLVMSDTVNFYDISLKDTIIKKGYHKKVKESIMPWNPTDEEKLSLSDIGFVSDVILFLTVNAYHFTGQLDILKTIKDPEKRIISVALRSPDDMKLLAPYSDVVLATGGITPLQIEALVDMIFGKYEYTETEEKKVWGNGK